jgi:hypothetical protein
MLTIDLLAGMPWLAPSGLSSWCEEVKRTMCAMAESTEPSAATPLRWRASALRSP